MNRRGFLSSILASGSAPYVSRLSGVLMPVKAIAVPEYPWTVYSVGVTLDEPIVVGEMTYFPDNKTGRFTAAELEFICTPAESWARHW